MEGGGGMSEKKFFSKEEAFVVEAMLLLYSADKVAIVDIVEGELHPFGFREYVDGKAKTLADMVRSATGEN